MKTKIILLALLLSFVSYGLLVLSAQAGDGGYMMIITRVSMGLDVQASIVTVQPNGTQQIKEVPFSRFSAKQMANNMTEVHKAALATLNQYQGNGWHVISVAPSDIANNGNTVLSQTIYYLEKK